MAVAAPPRRGSTKKKPAKEQRFKANQHVVYPAHGVGKVVAIEQETIAGIDVELYVVSFEQEKMILRVPTVKACRSGMRSLSNENLLKDAFTTLKGRARVKRTMWSRRAQEYEGKINSGELILISEVVRDLYRTPAQPEQSYSERQLYERALDRMVREVAAINKTDRDGAIEAVLDTLNAAREKAAAKAEKEAAAKAALEGDSEEAAA